MDRRQRKSREAIFRAFTNLLTKKDFDKITVGEIIEEADVGRATFYSHFETKDFLLKDFCEELFCHIFDAEKKDGNGHTHIFSCDDSDTAILHLFCHLQKNDNNVLALLSSRNNELFLRYFKNNLYSLVESHLYMFEATENLGVPQKFWLNHIVSTIITTLKWWIDEGMKESPEKLTEYMFSVLK